MKELPNPIRSFFENKENNQKSLTSRQLFSADSKDIDLKTDITKDEIIVINKMLWLDRLLVQEGMPAIYSDYLQQYMRLNISLDRKSRAEFVSINKADSSLEENAEKLGAIKNLL